MLKKRTKNSLIGRLPVVLLACTALSSAPLPGYAGDASMASTLDDGDAVSVSSARQTNSFGTWGFDVSGMDRSVKPGDDFYAFANGGWQGRTQIPADRSSFGVMDELIKRTKEKVRTIVLKGERSRAARGTDARKIGDLYRAFMDEPRLEALDARPLQPALAAIRQSKTKSDIARLMGRSHAGQLASFFRLSVALDDRDPTRYVLTANQSGLSLPRDYYLQASFAPKLAAYRVFVARMLAMLGWRAPEKAAADIVLLETRIAQASWSIAESQQLENLYHPFTVADLKARAPGFDWPSWLEGAGLSTVERIIVRQDTAFPRISAVFAETKLDTRKAWLAFRLADKNAPYLSRRFVEAHFDFHRKDIFGQVEDTPRWERGVELVNDSLGEVVGREYVARYFPASSKDTVRALVARLSAAFRRRIERVERMSAETKAQALEQLSKLGAKIGYPDRWRSYAGLVIDPTDLVGDVNRAAAVEWAYERSKLMRPMDRGVWNVTPQTVNGFYDQNRNEIVIPAAILQPPFFNPKADPAMNFGAIGGVIAHEMTHGFDSQGRKTDALGRLRDGWMPADAARFNAKGDHLGTQYEAYFVAPNAHLNGARTMSENIADLGGLSLALDAYRDSTAGKPAPVLDGFTGEQRVFLGWAQILRSKERPDALINQVTADPHSPDPFRVIGPMRNMDSWYIAWNVSPGQRYYLRPEERVNIW